MFECLRLWAVLYQFDEIVYTNKCDLWWMLVFCMPEALGYVVSMWSGSSCYQVWFLVNAYFGFGVWNLSSWGQSCRWMNANITDPQCIPWASPLKWALLVDNPSHMLVTLHINTGKYKSIRMAWWLSMSVWPCKKTPRSFCQVSARLFFL